MAFVTQTTALPSSTVTATNIYTSTTDRVATTCTAEAEDPAYTAFTPIYGTWDTDMPGVNPSNIYGGSTSKTIALPWQMCLGNYCSASIDVWSNGYFIYNDVATGQKVLVQPFGSQDGGLEYFQGQRQGVYYRITGSPGNQSLVVSWYADNYGQRGELNHFTTTYFQNTGIVQFKYYDVMQYNNVNAPYGNYTASAYINFQGYGQISVNPHGQPFSYDQQFQIVVPAGGPAGTVVTNKTHDRSDCCVKAGVWHSCTEFQVPSQLV
ncbi:hypothetical protein LTR86_005912 [Recurvomyces mirabilis]|nr:hypothetical protein LTR86_005912 [Recurvomyces mirabilis]